MLNQRVDGKRYPIFDQFGYAPGAGVDPTGYLQPFHLVSDPPAEDGETTNDITHSWGPQHQSWNGGAMDAFVSTHIDRQRRADNGFVTMGYFTRDDLAFYYALADAFSICDDYHCSVLGPTDPNRLMSVSATIDPAGTQRRTGRRDVQRPGRVLRGVQLGDHARSPVGRRGELEGLQRSHRPLRAEPVPLLLPVLGGVGQSRAGGEGHHPHLPGLVRRRCGRRHAPLGVVDHVAARRVRASGSASRVRRVPHQPGALDARLQPDIWATTVLFVTYDENGGFFDHVPPPTPPAGTDGEYLTASPLPAAASGIAGPIGLGFRVPCLVVSPFSRGGWYCPDPSTTPRCSGSSRPASGSRCRT